MALKLRNGKMLPFMLSAASNVRTYNNSYDWRWHNIFVGKHSNFMFDKVEELQPQMSKWEEDRSVRYSNGKFITAKGMCNTLKKAFAKPIHFESGLILVEFIKVSEDRTKAERISYKPKTEEDFLAYMEENKDRSINIMLSTKDEW